MGRWKNWKGWLLWAGIGSLVSGTHFESRIAVFLGSMVIIIMATQISFNFKETQE